MVSSSATAARAKLEQARLYWITPDREPEDLTRLARMLAGHVDVIQLRHKALGRRELVELGRRMRAVCAEAGVLFVVDDAVDVALLVEADGVHLGPLDLPVEAARRVAGAQLIIGASAGSPEAANSAVRAGADYIGAGPAFPTPIKSGKPPIGPDGVVAVAESVDVPVFAIGGIDAQNVTQLMSAGVNRVCVIRALADARDPADEAARLRALLA